MRSLFYTEHMEKGKGQGQERQKSVVRAGTVLKARFGYQCLHKKLWMVGWMLCRGLGAVSTLHSTVSLPGMLATVTSGITVF